MSVKRGIVQWSNITSADKVTLLYLKKRLVFFNWLTRDENTNLLQTFFSTDS